MFVFVVVLVEEVVVVVAVGEIVVDIVVAAADIVATAFVLKAMFLKYYCILRCP